MSCTKTIMFCPTVQHNDSNSITSESNDLNQNNYSNKKCKQRLNHHRTNLSHLIAKNNTIHSIYLTKFYSIEFRINLPIINRILLIVTIILFASLNDVFVRNVNATDLTGVVQINGNAKDHSIDSFEGITPNPIKNGGNGGFYNGKIDNLDKIDTLEMSLAAVFNKVAYGTTTKRSIADTGFVPSATTAPTPQLTTYRYRERDKETDPKVPVSANHQYQHNPITPQKHANYNNKFLDLEHDHALPTSAPNADILKSNSNPTYPNPNRHHNHGDRHRTHLNSTPLPPGHGLAKGHATIPIYPAEMPSYSPPSRSFFTPRMPSDYQNPFAEQPTLRGTNSESSINSGFNLNRRPIPPPSLMPGQEKIPFRPPDLKTNTNNNGNSPKNRHHSSNAPKDLEFIPSNDSERKKALNTPAQKQNQNRINLNQSIGNTSDPSSKTSIMNFPISRILSGSNGLKGDIPEVLLRTVTARPSFTEIQSSLPPRDIQDKNDDDSSIKPDENDDDFSHIDDNSEDDKSAEDDFDSTTFNGEEPKMQPKIKQGLPGLNSTNKNAGAANNSNDKKVSTESSLHQSEMVYSTQIIHDYAATNADKKIKSSITGNSKISTDRSALTTWAVAWNIHVYLSAILFTILAVYSIFKMIFYDKLTHLVNQSYFICLHMILIIICLARIFFLCYDAYNIHYSFHLFISELLLNLPATFLTVSFSILILFLLLRSLNHKNNRYSALMRPLTVFIGSTVHVILCITLHYVESHGQQQRNQHIQIQQQILRNHGGSQAYIPNPPPRVLSLICQLIYIFICFSLGFFYLYIYKVLKRVLHKKSQNYIHGYQNLSYAIHITIATALLFILLAALQIYGAISISTTRPIMSSLSDNDWQQWGYQFSLRLIEIAIIALLSWVTGLKTGATKVLQRDKALEQHNVSGFALFPCTSSSSQEHFETDYPAICNANTNLHSYTLRTGKPLYDDTFALNSLGMENPIQMTGTMGQPNSLNANVNQTQPMQHHHHHHHHMHLGKNNQVPTDGPFDVTEGTMSKQNNFGDRLNDSGTIPDHYENPNFELHTSHPNYRKNGHGYGPQTKDDECYNRPVNEQNYCEGGPSSYDFQNFERPNYTERAPMPTASGGEFRASKNLKALVKSNDQQQHNIKQNVFNGKSGHYNAAHPHNYNSFERHGIRKSGTLNNIGNNSVNNHSTNHGSVRHNAMSTLNINLNNANAGRSLGVRTLNASRSQHQYDYFSGNGANTGGGNNNNILHRSSAARHSNNSTTSAKDRHQNQLNTHRPPNLSNDNSDEIVNDYGDNVSNASSEDISALNFNPDMVLYKRGSDHQPSSNQSVNNAPNSASSGDSTSSMLVAEHGFVRFRPLDDIGNRSVSSSINSDNNNINKNSPASIQRHHKRSLTNS